MPGDYRYLVCKPTDVKSRIVNFEGCETPENIIAEHDQQVFEHKNNVDGHENKMENQNHSGESKGNKALDDPDTKVYI